METTHALADFEAFCEREEILAPEENPHFKSDVGYADAFAGRFAGRIKFVPQEGRWLVFSPARGWHRDNANEVDAMAADFARELFQDACRRAAGLDPKAGQTIIDTAARLGDRRRIAPALELAKSNRNLVVDIADLDADPLLLGVRNGIVDLRDGSFRRHSPEVLVTRSCACDFDPNADCPLFKSFLAEVQPDPEMRAYLQRLFGYSITGLMGEHILPFHFGTGANGKGTFLEQTILKLVGDYGRKITDGLIYLSNRGNSKPDLEIAGLVGVRFALGPESPDGGSLNERLLKDLSGGDRQKGREHFQNFFEFWPTAKIHLVGNHRPKISGRDDGIWRRFRLVDWPVKIPDERKDHGLKDRLEPEFAGILNWLIAGALALGKQGTRPPEGVMIATEKFREDSDAFGDFLREKTIRDPAGRISKAELFGLYKSYCEEQEIQPRYRYNKQFVGKLMLERGFEDAKSTGGARLWLGLRKGDCPAD